MPRRSPARLITFEGTEGAGKTTLIQAVQGLLVAGGTLATVTREPGGSPVAERIRTLVLEQAMDPMAELFLYEAARAEHVARTIRPALAAGRIVLCDRYTDSSLAYQAHARGLAWKDVAQANHLATGGLTPLLTVWIDVDPAAGLKRAKDPNRFEAEGVAFHKKVRQGFLKASRVDPRRWLVLKARSDTPEMMATRVVAEISKRLGRSATSTRRSAR